MNISWRQGVVFAVGAAIGGVAVALISPMWRSDEAIAPRTAVQAAVHQAATAHDVSASTPSLPPIAAQTEPTASATTHAMATQAEPCPTSAIVAAGDKRDGQFEVLGDLSSSRPNDVGAFIVIGKEAAASGRPRDAEVAFLMACRVAEKTAASDPVTLADAKYQLGWHYGNLGRERQGASRDALARRAQALYGESLQVYTARLGPNHERSRFAANGLAALKQPAVPAESTNAQAKTRSQAQAQSHTQVRPDPTTAARVAGAGPERPARAPAQKPRPSFECAKARSVPERIICSDPQLAQLDRELGNLHARVKNGSSNPSDFKRRSDDEWRQREASCRDRECLLAWYAHRRAELLDELDEQRSSPGSPTAAR